MDYRQKLIDWNSTDMYCREMKFLRKMLSLREGENVLDYGCGLGVCVEFLNKTTKAEVCGYDVEKYVKGRPYWFKKTVASKYDKVFLMHSLAHMRAPIEELTTIKQHLKIGGRVIVITPNKDFCERLKNKSYVPDPTVMQHFTPETLEFLFKNLGFKILIQGQFGQTLKGHQERLFLEAKL